jgi:hypothetical protein
LFLRAATDLFLSVTPPAAVPGQEQDETKLFARMRVPYFGRASFTGNTPFVTEFLQMPVQAPRTPDLNDTAENQLNKKLMTTWHFSPHTSSCCAWATRPAVDTVHGCNSRNFNIVVVSVAMSGLSLSQSYGLHSIAAPAHMKYERMLLNTKPVAE